MMIRHIFLIALLALPGFSAHAADFVYTPEDCEFKLAYPEKPSIAQACNPENANECYEVSHFIQVFGLDSSIRITTTCNNAEPDMLERYSGEVMKFTLTTMASQHINEFQTGFNDHGIAKQAVLLGSKQEDGQEEKVYMTQLWIGHKSVFTIEGHLTGGNDPEADKIFSTIFKSIRHESWDTQNEPTENKE